MDVVVLIIEKWMSDHIVYYEDQKGVRTECHKTVGKLNGSQLTIHHSRPRLKYAQPKA